MTVKIRRNMRRPNKRKGFGRKIEPLTLYRICLMLAVGIMFLSTGLALGYSIRVDQEVASVNTKHTLPLRNRSVLGAEIEEGYVNPFDVLNLQNVSFPVTHLRGCRNWAECQSLCENPVHFQACSAWAKSVPR